MLILKLIAVLAVRLNLVQKCYKPALILDYARTDKHAESFRPDNHWV